MLIIAEGTIHHPFPDHERRAADAWLGRSPTLDNLSPPAAGRDGSVSFTITRVNALRIS